MLVSKMTSKGAWLMLGIQHKRQVKIKHFSWMVVPMCPSVSLPISLQVFVLAVTSTSSDKSNYFVLATPHHNLQLPYQPHYTISPHNMFSIYRLIACFSLPKILVRLLYSPKDLTRLTAKTISALHVQEIECKFHRRHKSPQKRRPVYCERGTEQRYGNPGSVGWAEGVGRILKSTSV